MIERRERVWSLTGTYGASVSAEEITDTTCVVMHYNGILIWTSRIDFFAVAISALSIFFLERLLKVEAELNWHGKARSEAEDLRRSEK